ncbi:MAG: VacB/RNase II family 3'-5' exoribonuclease [Candidatus Gracilibacteria bacterium]|nr:VacB/RNase II family 3'-5' exoribonuclease [Candidatus Gracilibacteria bacterium]
MSKINSKSNIGNILTGKLKISYGIGFLGELIISTENLNGAKDGDDVKIERIGTNPNIIEYKVIEIIPKKENIDVTINKTAKLVEGIYKEFNEKGGFVKIYGKDEEIFVSKNNSLGAKNGDKVSCAIYNLGKRNEAMIAEILEKSKILYFAEFVGGKFFLEGKKEIQINNLDEFISENGNLENGDLISLELGEGKVGTIYQKLHKKWNNSLDELKIVLKQGIEIEFPKEVIEEVNAISEEIEESEIAKRVDLRNLYTITIDGPDTKDIDDAISIEILENGDFKLYVSIADVSHYVKEGSELDKEAKKRGNSYYFLDKVIPMLHEKLSNGVCSLNPNEDKLSMTSEIIIDKNGKPDISKSKVYKSVIRSNARLTYKEVQDIFEGKLGIGDKLQFADKVDETLIKTVQNHYSLSRKLNNLRKKEGELNFENRERKIILDEERNPIKFENYKLYESNDLIKSEMVIANEVVDKIYGNGPFLHRTHQKPKEKKIELLQNIFKYLEVEIDGLDINPGNIQKLLEKIKGHSKEKALSTLILRTLQLAKYTHTLEGHHGLALVHYSHFTSPIRRYSDLQIHRIISESLEGNLDKNHYDGILEKVATECSINEQKAENNERKINTLCNIKHLEKKIGKTFDATIMMINEKGTSVELDFANIGGEIILDKEAGYNYNIIEKGFGEILCPNGDIIKIGDKTKIKLISIDKDNLQIYFELI